MNKLDDFPPREQPEKALERLRAVEKELRAKSEELTRTREAVQREKQRYVDLFQWAPDPYLVTFPDGVIREANQAAGALLSTTPSFLLGKPLAGFVAEPEQQAFEAKLQTLPERGRVQDWEVRLKVPRSPDPFAAMLTVTAVRDRNGTNVVLRWLVHDDSRRKQAEEERYRILVEEVTDYAIFLLDRQGRILTWNRGAERIMDYAPDEIIDEPWTRLFSPEDLAQGVPEWEVNTALAEGRAEDERWHVKKDGSRFWASGTLTALRSARDVQEAANAAADAADQTADPAQRQQRPGGRATPHQTEQVRWFAKVLRDTTERQRLLERLRESEDNLRCAIEELEMRVEERTRALAQANEKRGEVLRQLVAAQEEERRRIARELHDGLEQHLAAFSASLKALEGAVLPSATGSREHFERLRAIASALGREAHHLAGELRPAALDDLGLSKALQQYVAEWSERIGIAAQFRCTASLDADHRLAAPLETTLYRIVQEALTNVVKHARGATDVSVILQHNEDYLLMIVEDNGTGFHADDIFSASPSGTPQLGLLGMKERAALIGGTLSIESAPGAGTTVFVRVPSSPDAEAPV